MGFFYEIMRDRGSDGWDYAQLFYGLMELIILALLIPTVIILNNVNNEVSPEGC